MNVNVGNFLENFEDQKTISGVKVTGNYSSWFEHYSETFYEALCSLGYTPDNGQDDLLNRMTKFSNAGEFLRRGYGQKAEMAAFGLIMFDRLVRAEAESKSYQDVFVIHEALSECCGYVLDGAARQIVARNAARAMLAKSPKQKEKAMVRECWDAWQKNPLYEGKIRYKGKSAFAKDMLSKYENLDSQRVIESWCLAWERETAT